MKKLAFAIWITLVLVIIATVTGHCQDWKPNPQYIKTTHQDTTSKPKFQCYGTTAKGIQCKRKVSINKGLCYQHAEQK